MLQKFSGALVVIVGLGACFTASAQETPPEAYIDPVDRQVAESGEGIASRPYPCAVENMEDGDTVISFLPIDDCVKMLPAEEWHGLWRNDFEGSQFCARPAEICHFDSVKDRVGWKPGQCRARLAPFMKSDLLAGGRCSKEVTVTWEHRLIRL